MAGAFFEVIGNYNADSAKAQAGENKKPENGFDEDQQKTKQGENGSCEDDERRGAIMPPWMAAD